MLIKKIFKYIILVIILSNYSYLSAQVSTQTIIKTASKYIDISFDKNINNSKIKGNPTAITQGNDTLVFIINLLPQGYIILSSNIAITPILGFSTEGDFNYTESSDNVLLQMIKMDMTNRLQIISNNYNATDTAINESIKNNKKYWQKLSGQLPITKAYDIQYGPLVKSVWGGVNCYNFYSNPINVGNYYTPNHYSPGCVATSTSIVMNYFEWPPTGEGYHTDYDNQGSSTGSYYANFGGTRYEWWRMLDEYMYKNSYPKHHMAMGKLAYHCAIAFDMDFENDGSTSNLNRTPSALNDHFRFTSHYKSSSWYSFWPRIRANIRDGYPLTLAISKTNGEGHAMVCDGYGQDAGQAKFYHLNFGWWGNWNGWYNIQGSWDGSGYTIIDGAVLDLLPIPIFNEPIYSENPYKFILPIRVGKNLTWDSFKIWESYNGSSYTLIESDFDSLNFHHIVSKSGLYRYKVQAKINDGYYTNSVSEPQEVIVNRIDSALISLEFDGNDSYFIKDNYYSDLDIKKQWTIESWVKINSLNTNSDWDVIIDREGVFSLYLIDDSDADYAIKFVSRNSSGSILASLSSDESETNLNFGNWVHIAISYDSTYATLFINGAEIQKDSSTYFRLNYSTKALNIGARYWSGYGRYFVGEIDEIRLSDTARYSNDFVPYRCMPFQSDNYTRLLLHLDEESGGAIGDASRHFYNTNLRSSPNSPNWIKREQKPSVIFDIELSATSFVDSATISWSTIYEDENIIYYLNKSTDRKNWVPLDILDGKGDSLTSAKYKFTEIKPILGNNYYQLMVINKGCKYFYSSIDSINVVPTGEIEIYPIPAHSELIINGTRGLKIDNIVIYDINGRLIEPRWKVNSDPYGNQVLDIRQLPIGMYFLRIEIEGAVSYKKFIVSHQD